MNRLIIYLLAAGITFGACNTKQSKKEADEIWINGVIHTLDSALTETQALVLKDGNIVATGNTDDMLLRYKGEVRDLKGMHVYPGWIDAHSHLIGYGLGLTRLDLSKAVSFEDMLNKTETYAHSFPGEWIIGRGWDQNDWESTSFPNKFKLDLLFPDRPVLLKRVDGHAALVNQKALDLAGINSKTRIPGGSIELQNGIPTGILLDNAVDIIERIIPKPERDVTIKAILQAQEQCLAVGLTGVCDAGIDLDQAMIYDSLAKAGLLKLRIYAMLNPSDENLDYFLKRGPQVSEQLSIRSFKLYADGALGSRGALLKSPYCDQPKEYGLLLHDSSWLMDRMNRIHAAGFQVNTHCIGDSANKLVLHMYASVLKGQNDKRWRIEHAQVVDPADMSLFEQYNIIPSVQPTHATSDMYWALARLCPDRMEGAYAYRSLMLQNKWLPLGTDFPVENINPLNTFYAAVFRRDQDGSPKEGFNSSEALDPGSTLKGMSLWAAKASFMDGFTGNIVTGKRGDFVLLKEAIEFHSKPYQIQVQETYISGKRVYTKKTD